MMVRVPTVTLFERSGCHLCDEAALLIESLRREVPPFQLVRVDIEGDDLLHARFLERIPVVEVNGNVVAELEPDRALLAAAIRSAASMAADEHDR